MRAEVTKDVPLLLLCAEDSEVGLVQLVDALNRGGRAPEVVAGVESDSSLLSAAADRMRGPALFVLCQSGDLDRGQVLRLEGLFSARKGPLHQLLVVELDASKPVEALPDIEAAMESITRARASRAPIGGDGEDRVPKREVFVSRAEPRGSIRSFDAGEVDRAHDDDPTNEIEVLGLEDAERRQREAAEREAAQRRASREDAERKAREEAEALAKAFHEEMLAAEAVLERRRAERESAEPASIVDQLDIGVPREVTHDANAPTRPLDLDIPVSIGLGDELPTTDEPDPEPPEPPASAPSVGREPVESLTRSLANVRVAEPLTPAAATPEAIQAELTPTDTSPRPRDPEESDTSSPTQHLEESESRRGWLLGLVGAVALGGVALFVMQGDAHRDARNVASAASAVPTGTNADVPAQPRPAAEPEAVPEPAEPEAVREPAEPEAVREPAEPEAIPEPDEVVEPDVVKPTASASVPPPPADSEALRIDDAISSGRLRALDSLLVARPNADAVDWGSARTLCRRKKVAGLPGWQLPSRTELSRLRRARMLGEGTFWSRDRGPHDDDAYAVVSSSGTANVYLQVEPAAKALCVRKR